MVQYKYNEGELITEFKNYVDATYGQHYVMDEELQALDVWLALGNAPETSRDTALKYLMRYGKKDGFNRKDILKTMHYCILLLEFQRRREEKQKQKADMPTLLHQRVNLRPDNLLLGTDN